MVEVANAPAGLEAVLLNNRLGLLRFLRARGAGADADDLLQDLWLKVRETAPKAPIADPLGYLFRMADNHMHDRHRSAARRREREAAWTEAAGQTLQRPAEDEMIARQSLGDIDRALLGLGDRTRAIFIRFRLDGIGQRTIANDEGISLSAVEKHLQRAYRAIRSLRAGEGAESPPPIRPAVEGASDADA